VERWYHIEAIFYGTAPSNIYPRFELYENGTEVRSFDFDDGQPVMISEDGMGEDMRP
jgi:hypothetical protein